MFSGGFIRARPALGGNTQATLVVAAVRVGKAPPYPQDRERAPGLQVVRSALVSATQPGACPCRHQPGVALVGRWMARRPRPEPDVRVRGSAQYVVIVQYPIEEAKGSVGSSSLHVKHYPIFYDML